MNFSILAGNLLLQIISKSAVRLLFSHYFHHRAESNKFATKPLKALFS